jgi:membrane-bound ClpP family serine protease
MSIGVGIFLMALGAILAFAVEATTPGINVNTLGIILLLTGLLRCCTRCCSRATCLPGVGARSSPAAARWWRSDRSR